MRIGGVLTAAVCVCAGGCGSLRGPAVEVVGVRVVETGPAGRLLEVEVEAENPNDEQLPLRIVSYRLTAGGASFSTRRSAEATLGRKGVQRLRLPVAIAGAGVGAGTEYRVDGSVQYVTPGPLWEVLFDTGLLRPKVGFTGRGVVQGSAPGETSGGSGGDAVD